MNKYRKIKILALISIFLSVLSVVLTFIGIYMDTHGMHNILTQCAIWCK